MDLNVKCVGVERKVRRGGGSERLVNKTHTDALLYIYHTTELKRCNLKFEFSLRTWPGSRP